MDEQVIELLKQIAADLAEIKQTLANRATTAPAAAAPVAAQTRQVLSASNEDQVFTLEIFDGQMREWKTGANAGNGAYVRFKLLEPYEGLNWGSVAVHYVDGNPPFIVQQAGAKVCVRGRIQVREFNGRKDLTIWPARTNTGADDIWQAPDAVAEVAPVAPAGVPAAQSVPAAKSPSLDDGDVPF